MNSELTENQKTKVRTDRNSYPIMKVEKGTGAETFRKPVVRPVR